MPIKLPRGSEAGASRVPGTLGEARGQLGQGHSGECSGPGLIQSLPKPRSPPHLWGSDPRLLHGPSSSTPATFQGTAGLAPGPSSRWNGGTPLAGAACMGAPNPARSQAHPAWGSRVGPAGRSLPLAFPAPRATHAQGRRSPPDWSGRAGTRAPQNGSGPERRGAEGRGLDSAGRALQPSIGL